MSSDAVIVFAGPSLAGTDAAEESAFFVPHGPAAQGDVLRAALLSPRAIVVIDGYFEHVPSVYHKEILWALHQGIPVYGAASTGALRAAELSSFGMIGIGAVFDAYASGNLVRDDAVALVHAPAEMGYAPLSEPFVNLRWTLEAARSDEIISNPVAARVLERCAALHYPDRSLDRLVAECRAIDPATAERLVAWLPDGRVNIKTRDAVACLERVKQDCEADTLPAPPSFTFHHTDAFESLMHEVLSDPAPADPLILDRLEAAAPDLVADMRDRAIADELALALDRSGARPVNPADLARQVTEFRTRHGLFDPQTLQGWLTSRGLDIDALSKHLEDRARIERARSSVEPTISDRMRRSRLVDD
ncbi:MAG: TfuA-like protein [Pseudomonadota bacterium]